MKRHPRISFEGIRTFSVYGRTNLVSIANMARPYDDAGDPWPIPDDVRRRFDLLVDRIIDARSAGKPVIWSMGAHVVKNGMSRYVIELVRGGWVTHAAGNGATSIHDFELAFLGETSENVAAAIEDGSFGMWEETGRYMNEAIRDGAESGLGYGESLYRYAERHPELFPFVDDCIFVQCQRAGVPYTCHISIGTDIIHQHPVVDFAALGLASGRDFAQLTESIAAMQDGGVFLNFGSAVSGPELFLKGLSLALNRGLPMRGVTAANFDIVPLPPPGGVSERSPEYYYRPRRNLVERLETIGGEGMLFQGLHQATIPRLFQRLRERAQERGLSRFPPAGLSAVRGLSGFPPAELSAERGLSRFPPAELPAERGPARPSAVLFPVAERADRMTADRLALPGTAGESRWSAAGGAPFQALLERIVEARAAGKPILVNLGGNVVGSGVNLYVRELIREGYITHLALNGASAFQDFELAAFGKTEEADGTSLARGRLGMWREPGELLHAALADGYKGGLGYGESLQRGMRAMPEHFPHKDLSLLYACDLAEIPCTVHVTIGTDAVQQHPDTDFRVQGGASGIDFRIYCETVSRLDGGVFMNFGSTVTGPEVFLKALSIARNLGFGVRQLTTANFDIVRLGDYRANVGYEDWDYYYRPRKNIIHRPTSLGGAGYHFEGLHQDTIPALWHGLVRAPRGAGEAESDG